MTVRLTPDPTFVAISIGSNLGDREAQIAFAFDRLAGLFGDMRASTVIETEPVDVPTPQPKYLNAAATGTTILSPRELLNALMAIERDGGRTRTFQNAARTLDLDLLLYGEAIVTEDGLIVPHPRFRERSFVLGPLAEIAADWRDPVTRLTMAALLARLPPAPSTPQL